MVNPRIPGSILLVLLCFAAQAQFPDKINNGIRYRIDSKDTNRFITLNVTSQIWARQTEQNPGTLIQTGTKPETSTTDFSIRRIRFVLSGSLTDRINFFIQFGQNNLNYLSSRKAGSFFHDVTADYAVIKKKLSIGFGLNGWNGPSRFSNISISSILVLDPPAFQEVTNDTYDQFVRRLGMYAKGKLGRLDYRVSLAKPFVIQTAGSVSGAEAINAYSAFSTLPPKLVSQGYFNYAFFDTENNLSPAMTGTYLGKKKVLSVGAGFLFQKNAMFHYGNTVTKDTVYQDMALLSADVFYDAPVNRSTGTAISAYASFSHYDYGYQFLRVAGADNPAATTANKAAGTDPNTNFVKFNYGNAFPYLGTGNIGYLQVGYKLKNRLLGDQGTLQPFADIQYANYVRLSNAMYVYDIGVNWLLHGNKAKFTLNYQNRPYFISNGTGSLTESRRLGEWVLQYQIAI